MLDEEPIKVEAFYHYGYKGRDMIAIIAPYPMSADAAEIIGRTVLVGSRPYEVAAVARQISGPIAKGEPIGIEARAVATGADAREPRAR
ncbi:hypothetical protein LG047_09025 [Methylocystis sp. WRRC1]|uniref:hypothetical protein n=1 Tax=unclassified Methylocystis TaxID=2625913 RepID=UPI0001F885D4|nr:MULTISPECIES: hypothetical protein [unclassified Methylocystis]MCC3245461.1 hypothetical protein [Methylocystis sp. WRRC1]